MANRLTNSVQIPRSFGQYLHTMSKKEITCTNERKI